MCVCVDGRMFVEGHRVGRGGGWVLYTLQREPEFISILIKNKNGPASPNYYVRSQVVRIKYSFVRVRANKTNPIIKCFEKGTQTVGHPSDVTLIKNLIIITKKKNR